jgi:hypothetical protein
MQQVSDEQDSGLRGHMPAWSQPRCPHESVVCRAHVMSAVVHNEFDAYDDDDDDDFPNRE